MFLFFGVVYIFGFLGMSGITIAQIIEVSKAAEQIAEALDKL